MSAGTEAPRSDRPGTGILLMQVAVLCFTAIDTCAKYLVQQGLPPLEIVFFRYFGHFVIVAAVYLPLEGMTLLRANKPKTQVLRALFLLGSTILNFLALQYLHLGVTSAIFFTIPLLVCALSVPFLGEQVGPRRWAAICVGLLGVLIIVRPGLGALHWAWLLSIGAATSAACYMITTRKLAGVDSTETSQFYAGLVAVIVLTPIAIMVWETPTGGLTIMLCVIIGFFGWLGHQCLTIAHRFAPASTLAPYSYSQILWMVLSGYVIFANVPDFWVFAGAGIVIGSGLYLWKRERHLAREGSALERPPK
jgi:drug/metabolite transporter (DMT)-like permease